VREGPRNSKSPFPSIPLISPPSPLFRLPYPLFSFSSFIDAFVLSRAFEQWLTTDDLQFGFKNHNSCSHALITFKESVKYVDDLIGELRNSGYGIYIGRLFAGCILYAGDILLVLFSCYGLQSMLNVFVNKWDSLLFSTHLKLSV